LDFFFWKERTKIRKNICFCDANYWVIKMYIEKNLWVIAINLLVMNNDWETVLDKWFAHACLWVYPYVGCKHILVLVIYCIKLHVCSMNSWHTYMEACMHVHACVVEAGNFVSHHEIHEIYSYHQERKLWDADNFSV